MLLKRTKTALISLEEISGHYRSYFQSSFKEYFISELEKNSRNGVIT
jgi:hypothetical protein